MYHIRCNRVAHTDMRNCVLDEERLRTDFIETRCEIVVLIYHIHVTHLIILLPSTFVIVLVLHATAQCHASVEAMFRGECVTPEWQITTLAATACPCRCQRMPRQHGANLFNRVLYICRVLSFAACGGKLTELCR